MRKCLLLIVILLIPLYSTAFAQDNDPPELELGQTLVVSGLNFTIAYPTGWVHDISQRIAVAQPEADLAALTNEDGITEQPAPFVLSASPDDLPNVMDLPAREAAETLTEDMEKITPEGEFWVGDARGFGFSGLQNGSYIYFVAMTPTEDGWTVYSLSAGDRETGEAAIPSFITMLKAVTTVDA